MSNHLDIFDGATATHKVHKHTSGTVVGCRNDLVAGLLIKFDLDSRHNLTFFKQEKHLLEVFNNIALFNDNFAPAYYTGTYLKDNKYDYVFKKELLINLIEALEL